MHHNLRFHSQIAVRRPKPSNVRLFLSTKPLIVAESSLITGCRGAIKIVIQNNSMAIAIGNTGAGNFGSISRARYKQAGGASHGALP